MNAINTFNAGDYINMMTAVAKNNFKYFARYGYELDEIISELYIEVFKSLNKLKEKSEKNHYNIDGWVMQSMYNKIRQMLNKETYRIKKNLYVEVVRPEEKEFYELSLADNAIEHTRKMLNWIETDVLDCMLNPPQSLIQKESKTYSVQGIADYLGITRKEVVKIIDKIRNLVYNQILTDDLYFA